MEVVSVKSLNLDEGSMHGTLVEDMQVHAGLIIYGKER